jgi:hypothetical protein
MARKPALRGLLIDDATKQVTDGLGNVVNMNVNSITASNGMNVNGALNIVGSINATNYNIVSSSVVYATGSSQLGDSTADVQTLVGTTKISGSLEVTGSSKFKDVILLSDAGLMFASDGGQDSGLNWQEDGVFNVRINNATVGQFTSAGFTGTSATATTASYALTSAAANNPQYGTTAATTGTISYDCSGNKKVHVHTASPAANWTANFTGLTLSATSENTIKLVVPNGDPAYNPTVIQIDGVAKSITKSAIKGDKNKTNIHTYTILGNGTYVYGDTGNALT